MIEDKELGLKIANDEEESFWIKTKETIEKEIKQMERTIEMDQVLLMFIKEKLDEKS